MLQKFRKLSLEQQIFSGFIAVSVFLLAFSLSMTFLFTITRQRGEIDKSISATAAYIASMDQVATMLENGYPDSATIRELDSISENFSDLDIIVIYNTTGLRFYHTNRKESGETFVDGEESAILKGSAPYITSGYGTFGTQRRAFHSIKNKKGEIVGFVMASVFYSYISDQTRAILSVYFLMAGIILIFSVLLSHGLISLLKESLHGHHPTELLDLYLRQDTVLNALDEGLVASNRDGTVIYANQAAEQLFPLEEHDVGKKGTEISSLEGKNLSQIFPESTASEVLKTGISSNHRSVTNRDSKFLVSEIPADDPANTQVVLTIIKDQTNIEAIMDELTGARAMLDTLRSFNHEFLNKLHVILGYLQTGQTEEAIRFIINSNLVSSQSIRQTADCLRASKICALVIGKMMHAAELGILLTVSPNSRCLERDLFLPMEDYVTIIGNLLENAIEELSQSDHEIKEITLGLYCDPNCNIITCEDTGRGIRPDLIHIIYEKGVSSKGTNRGTGLYLIKQIVDDQKGEISIDTEEGEGTCFTITFIRKETASCTT